MQMVEVIGGEPFVHLGTLLTDILTMIQNAERIADEQPERANEAGAVLGTLSAFATILVEVGDRAVSLEASKPVGTGGYL